MTVNHLPQAVQDALRMETLATAYRIDNTITACMPSDAAALLALVGQFVAGTYASYGTDSREVVVTAFERGYDTFMRMVSDSTPDEQRRASAYAADPDSLPPNTSDVLLGLRGQAVREATPIHNEKA